MKFRLTLEYDGTAYGGWQRQKNAVTVQQRVEEALEALTGKPVAVVGAGRTDAGVHALGQVCHFESDIPVPPRRMAAAVNTHLPADIRAVASERVPDAIHARYDVRGKHYRYTLFVRPAAPALDRNRVWHVTGPLDVQAMARAAAFLPGTHDFGGFMDAGSPARSTVRTLTRADVTARGSYVELDFAGTGFLYHMVRILSGTLVEIGQGKRPADGMPALLEARDRGRAGVTAPPQGLCLVAVYYGAPEEEQLPLGVMAANQSGESKTGE